MVKKEDILEKATTWDILEFYTRRERGEKPLKPMVNFQNPLLDRPQNTPSFNISYWRGAYYYNDYSTDHSGSAFDLVMQMYDLNFPQACAKINQDLQLGVEKAPKVEAERKYKPEPKVLPDNRNYDFTVKTRSWEKKIDEAYWGRYGITIDLLERFRCRPVSYFHAFNKDNKPYQIKAKFDDPLYFYQQNGWGKIYRPRGNPKYVSKNYTLGRKPDGFLFGYRELPKSGRRLFFTGGEKDVMALRAHGYYAVAFNSETADPGNYPRFYELIGSGRFGECLFLYDNDETGMRKMEENVLKYDVGYMVLPQMPDGYSDISDWFKFHYEKQEA